MKTFLKETKAKNMKDKIQSEIAKLGGGRFREVVGRLLKKSSEGEEYGKINFLSFIFVYNIYF